MEQEHRQAYRQGRIHELAKTSVDYTVSKEMGEKSSQKEADEANPSQGYLLNENLTYRWHWLRLSGSFSYFHTQDFSSGMDW